MKRIVFAMVMLVAITAIAQEKPETKIVFPGGEYMINENAMVITVPIALVKGRLDTYGQLTKDKQGQLKFNTNDKIVTKKGKEIYDRLMAIQTIPDLFDLRYVAFNYRSITIFKYDSVVWPTDTITKIIETVVKGSAK